MATPIGYSEFKPGGFMCINNAALAALQGEIVAVGQTEDVEKQIKLQDSAQIIDASGKTITPGFVDCHTHPIFHGSRENEFEMRIAGKSYVEIALSGGGIRASVRNLRQASKEELIEEALPRLDRFLAHGTTTIEAKSGYGLTLVDEIKSLEVIYELNRKHALELIPTFLGAHEIPDEYRKKKSDYLQLVIDEMIPLVHERELAEFCDVFCESHVFTLEDARKILEGAKDAGFSLKIHADQLTRNGATALAAELKATSADHLEYSNEKDWREMLVNKVVPVL
ncbi:MAG: imidazolonepropionase, partial [bacterium]